MGREELGCRSIKYMPNIDFYYSIEKDAENWIDRIFNQENITFISQKDIVDKYPKNLLDKVRAVNNYKEAKQIVISFLKNDAINSNKAFVIEEELRALRSSWEIRENNFFMALEKVLEKPIYTENFSGYLTTFFKCPYSEKENWFMVNFWNSLPEQITTIAHEILHLQFLHQYRPILGKSLDEEKIQKLKEALTFLLNEKEFYGILLKQDKGYEEHAILRKKLKDLWRESREFHLFLPKAIKIM